LIDISDEAVAYHERRAEEEANRAETDAPARYAHEELRRLHDIRAALLSAARRSGPSAASRTDKEA
jgi:hypothetical protein